MARNELSSLELKAREEISKNLKHYSRGITQKQLSEKTGIPTSTLSGYFSKRSTPNAGALQKIADALNIRKSDIDPRYKSEQKDSAHSLQLNDSEENLVTMFRKTTDGMSSKDKEKFTESFNDLMQAAKNLLK